MIKEIIMRYVSKPVLCALSNSCTSYLSISLLYYLVAQRIIKNFDLQTCQCPLITLANNVAT